MTQAESTWSEIELAGHPCHLFEPARPSEHGYTVIYLHGVGVELLNEYPPFTRQFNQHGLRVIQPVTGPSWWTARVWPEFDPNISAEAYVLEQVVPYVDQRWGARPPRIALLGLSMGGQGALRMAYKYPTEFPTVAVISPAVDFQKQIEDGIDPGLATMYRDAEEARQDSALLHVHPLNWPRNQFFCCDPADARWHDSSDRLRMKLSSLGVPYECDLETSAGGHSMEYACHMAERAVGFLAERLEQERLRVV